MAPIIKVLVLAGQSTAVGQSPAADVASLALESPADYAPLWDPVSQSPSALDQVFVRVGADFGDVQHEGPLSTGFGLNEELFGPELGIGLEWVHWQEAREEDDEHLVLLKTAAVGSLSNEWRPPLSGGETGMYYAAMIQEIANTMHRLTDSMQAASDSEGTAILAGFIWMVGYEDVHSMGENNSEYTWHLSNLLRNVRQDLNQPNLPMVVAALDSWTQTSSLKEQEMQKRERQIIQSMGHVSYSILDSSWSSSDSLGRRTLEIGRQVLRDLMPPSPIPKKTSPTVQRTLVENLDSSLSMLMSFELDPRQVQAGENCDDLLADLIKESYNQAVPCIEDASCQAISAVMLNEDLVSYASLSGDGFIPTDAIFANVRFDVMVTGSLQGALFPVGYLDVSNFVATFNANLNNVVNATCPGAIVAASNAVDLVQNETCSEGQGATSENFRLSFRLKDTTGTFTQEQLEQLTNDFNKLGVATYNELNALNPNLCDPLHHEASIDFFSARRRERDGTPLMDRPLERSLRKRLDYLTSLGETRKLIKDPKQIKGTAAIKSAKSGSSSSKSPSTKSPSSTKTSKSGGIIDTKSSKGPSVASDKSIKSIKTPGTESEKSAKGIKSGETESSPSTPTTVPGAAASVSSFATSCVGVECNEEGLFSDDSTEDQGRRRLVGMGENECLCPDGDNVEERAPTQEEFQELFEATFLEMQAAGAFPELACVRPGFVFNATIVTELQVEAGTQPTVEDIMSIGNEYQNQYNQLNLVEFCDPFARSLNSFTFTTAEITPETSRRRGRDLQFGFFSTFLVYYTYTGSCTNCRRNQGLYNDVSSRRTLQGTSLSQTSTCLCSDPEAPALTEEVFAEETEEVFEELIETLPNVESGEVLMNVPAFECPTGVSARTTNNNNFFELLGGFFGLDILDVRVELNEYAATCAGSFNVTGVKAYLLKTTPTGVTLGTEITAVTVAPISGGSMLPDMANFVVRFQLNFVPQGITTRQRVGFVLQTSSACGNTLGPKQVSLTPNSNTIICLPLGSQDIIVPPPLTPMPSPAPTPGPTPFGGDGGTGRPTITAAPSTRAPEPTRRPVTATPTGTETPGTTAPFVSTMEPMGTIPPAPTVSPAPTECGSFIQVQGITADLVLGGHTTSNGGTPLAFIFSDVPMATGNVTLTMNVRGDFGGAPERAFVEQFPGICFHDGTGAADCGDFPPTQCTLSDGDFNALIDGDGVVTLTVDVSDSVVQQCDEDYVEVSLSYDCL